MRKLNVAVLALVLSGWFTACDEPTASDPLAPALAPQADASVRAVPLVISERFAPAPDAALLLCQPAEYGLALPNRLVAEGVATHLGRITSVITSDECIITGAASLLLTGIAEHAAANGDALFAAWSGTLVEGAIELEVTITGGTGRFAGAGGAGILHGTLDPATVMGTWRLEGSLVRR